jgi:1-acyl-sn-glycerol-3-phosphate acyltransferase
MSPVNWALGLAATAVVLVLLYRGLPWLVQPMFRLLLAPRYRLQVRGLENLPRAGPVLLAANHVTWLDGFFLVAACPRRGRCLINADYIRLPILRSIARRAGLIPVPASGPRAQRAAIEAARATLDRGAALAIFPEAQLSRNGLTGPFYRGLELILAGREHVPVIPVFLDNLWGSVFSYSGGRFFRKWPRGLRRTVIVAFGPPIPPPVTAFAVRQALLAAGVRAFELRQSPSPLETLAPDLPRLFHPTLGLLAASTADFDRDGIRQTGHKPGTVGHPVPGVALRAVDDAGQPLPPDAEGRLEALLPGRADWTDTGSRGSLDREGFVRIAGMRQHAPGDNGNGPAVR